MAKDSVQLLQGTLDLIVLQALSSMGPLHAYALAARLEQMSDAPFSINQGTLYPALVRLEQRGHVRGLGARRQLFEDEHAAAIITFVDRWRDVERIVVHCVADLGRSPGVALAIADLQGWPTGELERRFPMWNRWVRDRLVSAGRSRDSRRPTKRRRSR